MPPRPLRSMILQTTIGLTLRTNSATPTILQSDRDRLRCHIQLNARDFPRLVQTQQQPIMRLQTISDHLSEHHSPHLENPVNSMLCHEIPREPFQPMRQWQSLPHEEGFLFLPASAFVIKQNYENGHTRNWMFLRSQRICERISHSRLRGQIRFRACTFARSRSQRTACGDVGCSSEEFKFQPDWRFDPMITWTHSVPVTNQSVRVPPGEIMVSLVSKQLNDEAQLQSELPPGSCAATVGLGKHQRLGPAHCAPGIRDCGRRDQKRHDVDAS